MERSLRTFNKINKEGSLLTFDEINMERSLPTFNEIKRNKLNEECGIIGIFNPADNNSASLLFYGLYALQHLSLIHISEPTRPY